MVESILPAKSAVLIPVRERRPSRRAIEEWFLC